MLKEVIVVEGKDDLAAVKRACQAEVIITNGLGITNDRLAEIQAAKERCGVIILTDPDYPGEKIRGIVERTIPGCKHAYLPKGCPGNMPGSIGVEYASPETIRQALEEAHSVEKETQDIFTLQDLFYYGLTGDEYSNAYREKVSQHLHLVHNNTKRCLGRLNAYGISRKELEQAIEQIKGER